MLLRLTSRNSTNALVLVALATFLTPTASHAQARDSLFTNLNNARTDSSRISSLIELGTSYFLSQPDSAKHYWEYALVQANLAQRTKPNASYLHYAKGNLFNLLANYHVSHSEVAKGTELLELALNERQIVGDSLGMAQCYNNLAFSYYRSGRMHEAIDLLYKSLGISIALSDSTAIAYNYHNIGQLLMNSGDLQGAEKGLTKSLVMRRALKEPNPVRESMNSLAQYYRKVGRPKEALPLAREGLEISMTIGDSLGVAKSWESLGHTFESLNNLPEAQSSMRRALGIYERTRDLDALSNGLINMAGYALRLGTSTEAVALAERGTAIAKEKGAIRNLRNGYSMLAKIHKARSEVEKVYEYRLLFFSIQDSLKRMDGAQHLAKTALLFDQESERTADSLTNRAETKEQEREAALARQATIQNKNVFEAVAVIGGVILLATITLFIMDRRRRIHNNARKAAKLQTQAFRTQVNPHFIHSALESINDFVQANESDLASSFLTRFARLMRAVLENARQDEVTLKNDLDVLRDYLELERTRTQNRFNYSITVDPTIDQEEVMVPPMLLQPFAEEAIWKSLAQQVNGSISITISKVEDALLLTVQDDGEQTGAEPIQLNETGSDHGVSITKARLELYQQTERRPATLRWTPVAVGHKVEVLLPWRSAA